MNNVVKIKVEKEKFKGEKFLYDCPFLIDNICSVYEYRGIICRSFGLMNVGANNKIKVPFCCFEGYNYSNVMADKGNKISTKKFTNSGVKTKSYFVSLSFIKNAIGIRINANAATIAKVSTYANNVA